MVRRARHAPISSFSRAGRGRGGPISPSAAELLIHRLDGFYEDGDDPFTATRGPGHRVNLGRRPGSWDADAFSDSDHRCVLRRQGSVVPVLTSHKTAA